MEYVYFIKKKKCCFEYRDDANYLCLYLDERSTFYYFSSEAFT